MNILKQNGGHRYLIRRLLNDATTWINFRHRLLTQVEAIRKFCNEYENQGYEDQASKVVVYTISDFEDVIKSRFDEFDAVSSALIQLVSIMLMQHPRLPMTQPTSISSD